eukprot:TRINITY_DN2767_c0_g1_i1.p1 TRINITY_DN2767_c0_g1~~TRINITY_DN2767_c0_g1_i1.p1  ORF type:complete len:218 (+),score=47.85 TRINITY_DN2767_c0_g1_i1:83-655(+)
MEKNTSWKLPFSSILSTWTTLKLAVDSEFGGSETLYKARGLYTYLLELLDKKNIDSQHLEEVIENYLIDSFHMVIEGGLTEISNPIMNLQFMCKKASEDNDYSRLNSLLQFNHKYHKSDYLFGGEKPTHYDPELAREFLLSLEKVDNNVETVEGSLKNNSTNNKEENTNTATSPPPKSDDEWTVVTRKKK